MRVGFRRRVASVALCWLAAACSTPPESAPVAEAVPAEQACPAGLPEGSRCFGGRDSAGAFYVIARPREWNGVLVLHAHGGPSLGAPRLERTIEDLQRWAIFVRAGYAWAGSSFRQGGVAVTAAAEDTERLRRIALQMPGLQPRRTILHGQSWGAGVAARAAELYGAPASGARPYDAVLLTSGVLGGGSRSYDFRLDLRVVYQQLCNNHPRPDEPAYPLWMGLPAGATLTQAQLAVRINECLALDRPAAQRTREQQARVETIERVIRIPERSILGHLNWATWHFQDIVQRRTGGGNPFSNEGVRYAGSADDAALNAAVPRYRADAAALQRFAADADPSGRIAVPVLSVRGIDDPIAFVELDSVFGDTMRAAGAGERLLQTFTAHAEHSYLADPVYPALAAALLEWAASGRRPSADAVAERCRAFEASYGPGCRFLPAYRPAPLETRVPARLK
ncbi:hypothetical protein HLB44_28110 [Aquincola sp. S2]|uniref:Alpha/beta hydrolase n=1 Tax=Pseudaquabacterium terrae TaxID=2732868 RepID=A0ABX2EQE7_9BURK|nr:hypothetical protein [Aquabacterium terrae]NRF70876.1 hypothetical protein [Aquabacterium terrae]